MIDALKKGHLGAAGLDVYEVEEGVFFFDLSDKGPAGRYACPTSYFSKCAHYRSSGISHT
jgi:lactate dehydrogenase-like 2-hydroxyacid dehydrogenase